MDSEIVEETVKRLIKENSHSLSGNIIDVDQDDEVNGDCVSKIVLSIMCMSG